MIGHFPARGSGFWGSPFPRHPLRRTNPYLDQSACSVWTFRIQSTDWLLRKGRKFHYEVGSILLGPPAEPSSYTSSLTNIQPLWDSYFPHHMISYRNLRGQTSDRNFDQWKIRINQPPQIGLSISGNLPTQHSVVHSFMANFMDLPLRPLRHPTTSYHILRPLLELRCCTQLAASISSTRRYASLENNSFCITASAQLNGRS